VLFNSYVFILAFLPLTLAGFWLATWFGRAVAGCWLVAASLMFYGWWRPGDVPLLVLSVAANYAASRLIAATAGRRVQDWLLAASIAANVALLVRFKYLATLMGLVGVSMPAPVLPLGISFFTFTQIGFLIDCRQGLARERGWLSYALFVTFFPHLIAGPILHNREIMPQFAAAATYRASADNVAAGLAMFLIGLLKKCLLADPLAAAVATGFAHPHELALFGAWQAATSYSLQLYFDFSGYSDMAIGIARMFNLRFPANFNSPYKSQSVIEYWQRWHMTLTRYLMMYLYNPIALRVTRRRAARGLAVNRQGQATAGGFATMVLLPTWITLALAGVWHGSGATFLVFGLLHAAYLSVNHAWRLFRLRRRGQGNAAIAGRITLTYACVLVGSVVFRAPSLWSAGQMLGAMLGLHGVTLGFGDAKEAMRAAAQTGWILTLYVIVWAAPNTQQIMRMCDPTLDTVRAGPLPSLAWRISLPWAAALGCAAAIGLCALGGTGEFLYFQF
jgi:alginate O-acetyltransferase complex protein AlgI